MSNFITILKYHNIIRDGLLVGVSRKESLESFSNLLTRLRKHFAICGLSEAIQRIQQGEKSVIALTFDDSYRNYLTDIAPLLVQHQSSATFYICSRLCEQQSLMWNDQILLSFLKNPKINFMVLNEFLAQFKLQLHPSKIDDITALKTMEQFFKYHPYQQRQQMISAIQDAFGESSHPFAQQLQQEIKLLSLDEVRKLHQLGMEVGGHTAQHPILAQEQTAFCYQQIADDKRLLEQATQSQLQTFAYPNGRFDKDFNASHRAIVEQVNYQYAVSANYGISQISGADRFSLKRIELPLNAGAYSFVRFLLKRRFQS